MPDPAPRTDVLLAVEGIHCTACTQLIELRVGALEGVSAVDASLSTHRVRVRWDGVSTSLKDIVGAIARAGYRAWPVAAGVQTNEQKRARRMALWRLFVAGFSMMQVMMYAFPAYLAIEGEMSADIDALLKIASFILTVPVLAFSAGPLYEGAWRNLQARRIGMDVPVVIGLTVTFAASAWSTFVTPGPVYYDSVSMFVFLLLCGRFFEAAARQRASAAIDELARVQPVMAERLTDFPQSRAVEEVEVHALREGDCVLVRVGAAAPADGVVLEGRSLNDEALLTGESLPVEKGEGADIIGGAINLTGALIMRVTAAGAASRLSTIMQLMERAADSKPALLMLVDRYASVFLWCILALAIVAGLGWASVDPTKGLWVAVAILIVTCPCALSLAAPAAQSATIGTLARHGMLVASGHALESLARADHVVFDKTGTLTTGRMELQRTVAAGRLDENELLRLAGQLEAQAVHPVAQALSMAAAPLLRDPALTSPAQLAETPGSGVEGLINGRRYRIGSVAFAGALHGQPFPQTLQSAIAGTTVAAVADEAGWLGAFALGDGIRPGARAMVADLVADGRSVSMFTGDNAEAARRVAAELGIVDVHADMTAAQKQAAVKALQAQGAVVAMVGDGINDAPVLAQAHVAIAMGSGAPLTQVHADMVLMSAQPDGFAFACRMARRNAAVVRQNIAWAAAYNLIAIPLAALGVITPWMAGIGMSLSSLIVVANSLRLLRDGGREAHTPISAPMLLNGAENITKAA